MPQPRRKPPPAQRDLAREALALQIGLKFLGRQRLGKEITLRLFAALVPLSFWSLYFIEEQLRWGIAWQPELWAGPGCGIYPR